MAEDINPAVIKHTQETLGKYVKKPHLTEKLLKKPPFRFLHDVFVVVIRDTGCFGGLYTTDELNSDNIKDREDKMRFLQKMIDVVRICTNVPVTVKTSKIVAGHEAEKTNELLQLMGKIIENKLNWQPAVEQVLKGKDNKEQEKPKGKEVVKTKDPSLKATGKNTEKISKHSSVNKEDKIKKTKEKEKTTTTKQKASSKTNKVEDNRTTKKSKESTTKKLTKADSQSSNKSITPNKELKVQKKKEQIETPDPIQCSHEGMSLQDIEIIRKTSISSDNNKDNLDSLNKYIAQQKELMGPEINQEQHIMPSSLAGIASTSTKSITLDKLEVTLKGDNGDSRKSSGKSRKSPSKNNSVESPQNDGTNSRKSSGKRRKQLTDEDNRETTEDNNSKKSSVKSKPIEHKAEQLTEKPSLEQDSPARNLENVTALPETSLKNVQHETPNASKTAGIVNTEVKRESTFTRENSKDLTNKTNRPRTSLRPPSARPPSARPGAPRRRDRNIEIILQPNDQIKMSGIQVKLETFGDLDDDSENLVIIENTDTANEDMTNNIMGDITKTQATLDGEIVEQQGHLVQQILETQKELTQEKDFNQQIKNEKDSVNGMVMKQTSMNNLRDVIQNLTRSINPLGKLMDFIPEDIDAMQLEFTMWRDTYTQAANQLKREKSLTESATEPMKNQLLHIESNIQEYQDMIDASRVKILQSNEKILKMLTI